MSCLIGHTAFAKNDINNSQNLRNVVLEEKTVLPGKQAQLMDQKNDFDNRFKRLESTLIEKLLSQGHSINRFGRFDLAIGATGIVHGSVRNDTNSSNGDSFVGSGSFDMTVTSQFDDNFIATANLEAGVYNGLDTTLTTGHLFGAINGDDLGTGQNLALANAEVFLEASFFNEKLGFAVGLLDAAGFFDGNAIANDETSQFLNGGFINSTTLEFPQNYAIGLVSHVDLAPVSFSVGIFDGTAAGMDLDKHLFYIAEVEWVLQLAKRQHHYRLYGWANQDNTSASKTNTGRTGIGIGISFDQQVLDWLTFFERFGYARKSVYATYMSASAGLAVSGALYNRESDAFGIAGGVAISTGNISNEYVVEAYYNLALAGNHIHLSPNVQVIINPGGQQSANNALFMGMRSQLDF